MSEFEKIYKAALAKRGYIQADADVAATEQPANAKPEPKAETVICPNCSEEIDITDLVNKSDDDSYETDEEAAETGDSDSDEGDQDDDDDSEFGPDALAARLRKAVAKFAPDPTQRLMKVLEEIKHRED
jgi:hypothetical protein